MPKLLYKEQHTSSDHIVARHLGELKEKGWEITNSSELQPGETESLFDFVVSLSLDGMIEMKNVKAGETHKRPLDSHLAYALLALSNIRITGVHDRIEVS